MEETKEEKIVRIQKKIDEDPIWTEDDKEFLKKELFG